MTTRDNPGLQDHWYLQPWMTGARPQEDAELTTKASSPSVEPKPVRYSVLPSVLPAAFDSLRDQVIPQSPLFGGGLKVIRPPTVAAMRAERWLVGGLLAAALFVYVAISAGFPTQILEALGISATHALLWPAPHMFYWTALSLAALAVWRSGLTITPSATRPLLVTSALAGTFQISLVMVAGVLLGLGRSPYASGLLQMVTNLGYALAILVAIEMCRACVVVVVARTNGTLAIAVGTIVFALVRFPMAKLASVDSGAAAFSFLGGDLLPALAVGLVASMLVLYGGPLPAIVYGAVLQMFEWMSPVLPDLEWAATAFVGTIGPVVVLALLQPAAPNTSLAMAATDPPQRRWALATSIGAIAALWFVAGFFGIQPLAVSGPSMTPTFGVGDLVIVQDIAPEDVAVGDVVRFTEGSIDVIHRVVEIHSDRGNLTFVTQGDGNNTRDDPISASQIRGRVVQAIPKVGWPAIALRTILNGA